MITSEEFLRVLTTATSSKGVDRGRLRFLRSTSPTVAEKQFWEQMWDASEDKPQAVHDNPTRKIARVTTKGTKPLEPADIAWLQRLSDDPAKVTAAEVGVLVGLESQSVGSDSRLVRSILDPIRQHHARKEAEVSLSNLKRPLPKIPDSALPALAAVIQREMPAFSEDECRNRASQQMRAAIADRDAIRAEAVQHARAAVAGDRHLTAA